MMHKGTLTRLGTLLLSTLLVVSIWVAPSVASECSESCTPCHGNNFDAVHGDFNHSATLGSGPVALFPDNGHDDAGHVGTPPYFDVLVDCGICHNNDLPPIHGNDCATCHPTPYDTLGTWGRGCQQGGCHSTFHADSTTAHSPFENPYDPQNDCIRCHDQVSWAVTQLKCMNCHAAYAPGNLTPPVTTSNAQAEYYGPAKIDFSITENGKVDVGRTFYRLDGGAVTAGSYALVSAPGTHELEFWSKDQYGNTELAPKYVFFSIIEDNTPPVTTSNAQANYNQGATITLTATDDSPRGVKTTYYRLNDGAIQTGTSVVIPATAGTITYTLTFWSEDWAGNIETQKSVSFSVTSGTGTIRLVWGNSDTNPADRPAGDDWADWIIRSGSWTGTVVATGSGSALNNWDGVDDIAVSIGSTPYFVEIFWSWGGEEGGSNFSNVYVTTAGQVVRLSY
jgi:hypothetical protein